MISKDMEQLGKVRSTIREIFEYGKARAAVVGKENIFDFSIGNPSVPTPQSVTDALTDLITNGNPVDIHAYTSAPGDDAVRLAIADQLNRDFSAGVAKDNIYMTCGAAASLAITIKALTCPGDQFITCAPFFPEYKVFTENAGAEFVVVPAEIDSFQIDFEKLEQAINPHTKGLIVNSPNNPSGTIYSKETVEKLAALLNRKSEEYGEPIYLISDEPYRALVYDDIKLPYMPNFYDNTIVCYSYSKALSLPGERVGYVLVPDQLQDSKDVYAAVAGAGRSLGYVCAPSLFQKVVARCLNDTADLSIYKKNRDLLYNSLIEYGYTCVKPEGAFYIFPRTLESDAYAFCEKAKKYELLLVPGDDFGCPGHIRISYCVPTETVERALPFFKKLAEDYKK